MIHITATIRNPSANAGARQRTLLGPMWMAAWTMRVSTNSQASTIMSIVRALGDQGEGHHRIEQHRQLELVALVGGALGGVVGPGEAAHGEVRIAALAVHGLDGARPAPRPSQPTTNASSTCTKTG